jgi:hypothetical protein
MQAKGYAILFKAKTSRYSIVADPEGQFTKQEAKDSIHERTCNRFPCPRCKAMHERTDK